MKANCLMANLFDIKSGKLCDEIPDILVNAEEPVESFQNLILEFW